MKVYLLILFCMLTQISGQLIFKLVASRIHSLTDILKDSFTFLIFCISLGMYGISVFLWVEALRHADLSRLYMFFALAFILVPIGAHLFFKEPLTVQQLAGGALIVAGIVVANLR